MYIYTLHVRMNFVTITVVGLQGLTEGVSYRAHVFRFSSCLSAGASTVNMGTVESKKLEYGCRVIDASFRCLGIRGRSYFKFLASLYFKFISSRICIRELRG